MFTVRFWFFVAVCCAFGASLAGFGMAEMWERRPARWPNIHVLALTLPTPDSLGARLAQTRSALATDDALVATLRDEIAAQNQAVTAQSSTGAAAIGRASALITATHAGDAKARAAAVILAPPPKGDTVCARVQEIDGRFVETLRGSL
jgi:hypothetical protein